MQAWLDRLAPLLADRLHGVPLEDAREIRLRIGQPVEVRGASGAARVGEAVTEAELRALLSSLTGHSIYACEPQMREGFFTLPGGCRVGLTGRYAPDSDGPIQSISALSIRLSRHIPGASGQALPYLLDGRRVRSALILSPPCMGKTTLLRALILRLADAGHAVAVADERGELDLIGTHADVAAMLPKRVAIMRLIRAMAPDVVATDELGHAGDADAVHEAARCGVAVLATAHATGFEGAAARASLSALMKSGVFERIIELNGQVGRIHRILDGKGDALWTAGPSG